MTRTLVSAGAVCLASWLGLFLGAGYVGLSRSVAIGPWTLVEQPVGVALAVGLAFIVAVGAAMRRGPGQSRPLSLTAGVLVGDAIGALILAPLAVGELTPLNAPVVFAALAVLGLQPLAAFAGTAAPRALRRA